MLNLWKTFKSDEEANITVEFVLLFPLLALWFAGSFIFFDAFRTTSQAAKAAYTIGDIVSRQPLIPANYIDELYTLQENLLPRAPSGKWLRVTSIICIIPPGDIDGDGNDDSATRTCIDDNVPAATYEVLWSRARPDDIDGDTVSNALVNATIPLTVMPTMARNDTIVLVENFVPYIPIVDWLDFTGLEWRNQIVNRPRFSDRVVIQN